MNVKQLCIDTTFLVRKTAAFIQKEVGKVASGEIETKSLNSLVSYVDKEAEKQLVTGLKYLFPDSTFLTEEETVHSESGTYQWIIDPLDGTTNFLHQIPVFSISIALQYQGRTILGIVHEINRDECFYAWKNGGAFLNGQSIQTSSNDALADSLIATGFPYYDYSKTARFLKSLEYFMKNTRGVRRLGSAAVDLAYVACGRFDAFYEYSLHPWDVAAGAFLVQEAGGDVYDFKGEGNYLHGKEISACNKALSTQFNQAIQSFFKIS